MIGSSDGYPAGVRLKNEKQIPPVPFNPLPNFPDVEKTPY
jgi:hypothetical protein